MIPRAESCPTCGHTGPRDHIHTCTPKPVLDFEKATRGIVAGFPEKAQYEAELNRQHQAAVAAERKRLGPWLQHDGMVPADILFGDRQSCPGGEGCTCGLTAALETSNG